MRETITSIPINDIFGPKDGCPFCRMRDLLENEMATYITGAAMMEPDVRLETNRLGFCHEHFDQMLARGHKLSVALILESLLETVKDDIFEQDTKKPNPKKIAAAVQQRQETCFVCDRIEMNTRHYLEVMLTMWRTDPDFRKLYNEQTHICLPHYGMVMEAAQKLPKKDFPAFYEETTRLARKYLDTVKADVSHFCQMFDYRNAGGDWGTSVDGVERAILWLTSREPDTTQNSGEKNR